MLHQKYLVHQVQIQLEEEDQDIDEEYSEIEEDSEPIQIHQPQAEESQRTPHLKWKMMNQLLQEQEAKLSQLNQLQQEPDGQSDPEVTSFADVKEEKTLNEWLHEIAFVTSTMSDPDEPQSFQEPWWDPDLIARENW